MTEMQSPIYRGPNGNCDVHPELQNLIRSRSEARQILDFELDYVIPLLQVGYEDTKKVAARVDKFSRKLKALMRNFESAYADYMKRVEEDEIGDEEIERVMGEANSYLKEAKE